MGSLPVAKESITSAFATLGKRKKPSVCKRQRRGIGSMVAVTQRIGEGNRGRGTTGSCLGMRATTSEQDEDRSSERAGGTRGLDGGRADERATTWGLDDVEARWQVDRRACDDARARWWVYR